MAAGEAFEGEEACAEVDAAADWRVVSRACLDERSERNQTGAERD